MIDNSRLYRSAEGYTAMMAAYDATLARWPVPYECLTVPTRHGATHIITSGDPAAPPLILLGGAGANATRWLPNIGELSKDFRTYCLDGLGETGRSAPNRPSYRGDAYGEWLVDVFDALHLERANVAGISRGGWLTLKIAIYAPDRVNRIVPMSAQGLAPLSLSFLVHMLPVIVFPTEGSIKRLTRFSSAPNLPPDERLGQRIYLIFKHYRSNRSRVPNFTDDELRRISAPTLLLWGAYEGAYNVTRANERAVRLIRDLCIEVIPNAGHTVSDDQPALVNARITAFLKQT
ncbi:MAG: alpha/beta hydrolase [Anaerolineae bacterium]|nr:alpha/beta hydrolase [Anaerolineae bacterium]